MHIASASIPMSSETPADSVRADPARVDLTELYDRHGAALYRYLLGLLGRREAAEDALQEVFARVGSRRRQVDAWEGYLWRAARNEARRRLSWRVRRRQLEAPMPAVERFPETVNRDLAPDQLLALHQALDRLPFKQKEAVVLIGLEGLTAREAGSRSQVPTDTAASRYRLGLAKLRRILERAR
ncbi:MAG: sigma-70 family RNA polymerase sigma factor [Acidobacteriota bacterium]